MGLLDCLLEHHLGMFLDSHLPSPIIYGALVGARPKTQVLDVTHVLQTAVEKAIDTKSQGAVAQADVEKYYDSLSILRLTRWLESEGYDVAVLCAILRHQVFSSLFISLTRASDGVSIQNRCIGGLTGSRVAVSLARVPVETTIIHFAEAWQSKGFLHQISVCSWVDNLFALADSCAGAISILEEAETYLNEVWGLQFKASSLETMAVWGAVEELDIPARWRQVETMKTLGH